MHLASEVTIEVGPNAWIKDHVEIQVLSVKKTQVLSMSRETAIKLARDLTTFLMQTDPDFTIESRSGTFG